MLKVKLEFNVYSFEELSKEVQKKVLEENRLEEVELDCWYNDISCDLEEIDLCLFSFDINNNSCELKYIKNAESCADEILSSHGEKTSTYLVAKKFKEDKKFKEKDFLKSLSKIYLDFLKNLYKELTSDEYIKSQFELNNVYFFKNGKIYDESIFS